MITPEDYLSRPVRSLQTMLQVLSAVFPSLPNVNPDGVYGPSTAEAVSAFQKSAGLPTTGLADNETWNHLAASFIRHSPKTAPPRPLRIIWQPMQTISPGEENLHLFLIQAMIAALCKTYAGLCAPDVNGVYDGATQKAALQLQALFGLEADGVIDQTFWSYLTRLYCLTAGDGTCAQMPSAAPARFVL